MFEIISWLNNWGVKSDISKIESDLVIFKIVAKDDSHYADCQRLIPLMEIELRQLKAKL